MSFSKQQQQIEETANRESPPPRSLEPLLWIGSCVPSGSSLQVSPHSSSISHHLSFHIWSSPSPASCLLLTFILVAPFPLFPFISPLTSSPRSCSHFLYLHLALPLNLYPLASCPLFSSCVFSTSLQISSPAFLYPLISSPLDTTFLLSCFLRFCFTFPDKTNNEITLVPGIFLFQHYNITNFSMQNFD